MKHCGCSPPLSTIVREAIAADRIGDLCLTPRTVLMIAPWVLHRHQRLWHDPQAFLPSRFLPDQPAPSRFAFMPFGAGPRICVGAQLAMTEAVLVLGLLVRQFRITRAEARPVLPMAIITTQPDHAARVELSPRSATAGSLERR